MKNVYFLIHICNKASVCTSAPPIVVGISSWAGEKKKRWVHHHWNSSFSNKLPRKNLFGVKMLEFFLSVSNENYYFQRQFHALFTIFLIPLRVFFRSSGAVIFMAVGWNTQFSVEQSTTYQTIFRFSHFFLFRLVSVFSGKMVDDNNYTFK